MSICLCYNLYQVMKHISLWRKNALSVQLRKQCNGIGRGFTIIELLVVVVVIAILASITVVSYNGITNRAKETVLKSDLQSGAEQLQLARITSGAYPSDVTNLKKIRRHNV